MPALAEAVVEVEGAEERRADDDDDAIDLAREASESDAEGRC